jgi:hypothetical protein
MDAECKPLQAAGNQLISKKTACRHVIRISFNGPERIGMHFLITGFTHKNLLFFACSKVRSFRQSETK